MFRLCRKCFSTDVLKRTLLSAVEGKVTGNVCTFQFSIEEPHNSFLNSDFLRTLLLTLKDFGPFRFRFRNSLRERGFVMESRSFADLPRAEDGGRLLSLGALKSLSDEQGTWLLRLNPQPEQYVGLSS